MRKKKKVKRKNLSKRKKKVSKEVFAGYTHAGIPVFTSQALYDKATKIASIFKKKGYKYIRWNDEHVVGYKGKPLWKYSSIKGRYELMYWFKSGTLYLIDWKTDEDRHRKVPISRISSAISAMEKSIGIR